MAKPEDFIIVYITAASLKQANVIARVLVSKKAAACVSLTKVSSLFSWKGKLEKSNEVLMIAKSKRRLWKKLKSLVIKHHSYEVPEIIALPIITGYKPYLDWIKNTTS